MLQKDFFFEFAGMPKSGKTTVLDCVTHYLKRQEYRLEEYHGGGRYSGIDKSAISSLNMFLASKAAEFILTASERERIGPKMFIMDRGLFDRCIFTSVLQGSGKIDAAECTAITDFLTVPRLAGKIDCVYLFVTSPELSMSRENKNKLVGAPGRVMNNTFLNTLRTASLDLLGSPPEAFRRVRLIDTDEYNNEITTCAQMIIDDMLAMIGGAGDSQPVP